MRHVRAQQKRPFDTAAAYQTAPLVVLNNFSKSTSPHVKLMRATFEAMHDMRCVCVSLSKPNTQGANFWGGGLRISRRAARAKERRVSYKGVLSLSLYSGIVARERKRSMPRRFAAIDVSQVKLADCRRVRHSRDDEFRTICLKTPLSLSKESLQRARSLKKMVCLAKSRAGSNLARVQTSCGRASVRNLQREKETVESIGCARRAQGRRDRRAPPLRRPRLGGGTLEAD